MPLLLRGGGRRRPVLLDVRQRTGRLHDAGGPQAPAEAVTFGAPPPPPGGDLSPLADIGHTFEAVLENPVFSLAFALLFTFVVFLLRIVLRFAWLAYAAAVGVMVAVGLVQSGGSVLAAFTELLFGVVLLTLIVRFGLLAAFGGLLAGSSVTAGVVGDLAGWYAFSVWIPVLTLAAVAVFAFYVSLAGRPIFREALLET